MQTLRTNKCPVKTSARTIRLIVKEIERRTPVKRFRGESDYDFCSMLAERGLLTEARFQAAQRHAFQEYV